MNLDVFTYTDRQVRTVLIDGEPWFVARDILDILDLNRSSVALLDDDERGVHSMDTPSGEQQVAIISEAGLYSLILRSRKPEAKPFKRWLTHEVLPQIRRTGQYGNALPASFAEALELAAQQARAIEAQEAALALAAPKVDAFDALMSAEGDYKMDAAAKTLFEDTGLGRNKLYAWLRQRGVLMSTNAPYQEYVNRGWFRVHVGSYSDARGTEHATHTTYVTPRGLDGIRRMWTRRSA